MMINITKSGRK